MVIGLIMLITIINYLDRGTLNYMWVANIDYRLVPEADAPADKGNHAVLAGEQYILTAANGNKDSVSVANVQMKEKNGVTFVTNREGIAIDLGLIDRNDPDASQKAKVNVVMFGRNTDVEVDYVQIHKVSPDAIVTEEE